MSDKNKVTFNYDANGEIKHDIFYFLFEGRTFEKINSYAIIHLFEDAWEFGIKAAGKSKKMWEENYDEEYGSYVTDPSGESIQLENVWFSGFCGSQLNIRVKVDDEWEIIYNDCWPHKSWQYPIETGAIQEVLRFLKALADIVGVARGIKNKKEQKIKEVENNRRFNEYMKRKNMLDSFEINLGG